MTVIMAASFRDGIAIAADTLLHQPSTMAPVMNSAKTLLVGGRVGVAQAGTFTGTASVWDDLERMSLEEATPAAVAELIMDRASLIHAQKITRGEASIARYLVAGYNPAGLQEIRSVEVDLSTSQCFSGEGQIAALGTLSNAATIADHAVLASLIPSTNTLKVDEWVQRIVAAEAAASPQAVGFPATLLLIRPAGVISAQIEAGSAHDPRLQGYFA